MSQLTIDHLTELLRVSAGEAEWEEPGGDISGASFTDLGYDSLALIETAALIKRSYGIDVTDDIADLETPGALVEFVNSRLAAHV